MFKEHQPTLSASTGTSRVGRPWRALLVVLALTLAFSIMVLASEDAQAKKKRTKNFTQQDAAEQANYGPGEADGAPINDPTDPFTFRKTQKIQSLNRISLVLTVRPVDNDFDPNDLTLVLDGINTGLEATESSSDSNGGNVVLVFNGAPANAPSILAALKADARLQATLNDTGNNELRISDNFDTSLTIKGKIRR